MEKKTDIRAVDYEDYSMKVEINDAGKVVCCSEPKPTFVQIRIGDDWARFDNCASLQEFLDKVQEYGKLRKALDVAIDGIKKYSEDNYTERTGYASGLYTSEEPFDSVLQRVSEILKGGK